MSVRLKIFQRGFELIPSFILAGIFLVFWSKVAKGHLDAIDRTLLLAFRSPRNSDILMGPDWLLQFVRNITVLGDSSFLLLVICTFFPDLWCAIIGCLDRHVEDCLGRPLAKRCAGRLDFWAQLVLFVAIEK